MVLLIPKKPPVPKPKPKPAPKKRAATRKRTGKKVGQNRSTLARQKQWLAAYELTGSLRLSAEATGIITTNHHMWLVRDPTYEARFAAIEKRAADRLEDEAKRRATEGLKVYKFRADGEPIRHPVTGEPYYEHKFSDTLLIFLMKGLLPERYADNLRHTGPGGGPVVVTHHDIDAKDIDPAEAAKRYREFIGAIG